MTDAVDSAISLGLRGRVVLVTGGVRGVGAGISKVFADQGAYDAYTVHPAHVGFVETRWQTEVDAFQEYDFVAR